MPRPAGCGARYVSGPVQRARRMSTRDGGPVRGRPQGGALGAVPLERGPFVAAHQGTVRMNHPPPWRTAAPQGHDPADLAGAALSQVLGHVPIRHDLAGRDGVRDIEHPAGEVRQLAARTRAGVTRAGWTPIYVAGHGVWSGQDGQPGPGSADPTACSAGGPEPGRSGQVA